MSQPQPDEGAKALVGPILTELYRLRAVIWKAAHRAVSARSGSILRAGGQADEEGYQARAVDWLETVRQTLVRLREDSP